MTQTVIRMQDQYMQRVWTEADLAELPQDGTRYEIIDGRLYVTPPAGESHQGPAGALFAMLREAAPPGWRVLWEIGLKIGDDRLIPDLVVLPPGTPKADHDFNDVEVVKPELVIEIASKSTEATDRGAKMVAYADGNIRSYWRVTRDLTIHLHELAEGGDYLLVATLEPGSKHEVTVPFPMVLEPAKLEG